MRARELYSLKHNLQADPHRCTKLQQASELASGTFRFEFLFRVLSSKRHSDLERCYVISTAYFLFACSSYFSKRKSYLKRPYHYSGLIVPVVTFDVGPMAT